MPWSKMFIKGEITKQKGLYIATITYSYYGIYHYTNIKVFDTLEECEKAMLFERCGGLLQYNIEDDKKT